MREHDRVYEHDDLVWGAPSPHIKEVASILLYRYGRT